MDENIIDGSGLDSTSNDVLEDTFINRNKGILDLSSEILTPGMKQYQDAKKLHPDCLVMLRMGDFYEMFYQDAVTASRELEITLTSRGKGEKRAPLAGIPFHALDNYLGKLVKKGHKVAIVEQLEDPKKAKGLVKRGLVRIITPGTIIESSILNEKENNYLISLTALGEEFALAFCDLSTGEFFTTYLENLNQLFSEIMRLNPSECLMPESLKVNHELVERLQSFGCFLNFKEDSYFHPEKSRDLLLNHFKLQSLESFGLEEKENRLNVSVCGGLLKYLLETQKNNLTHLKKISLLSSREKMLLDTCTLKNLEITRNLRDNTSRGTLLSILDQTITAMGSRLIRKWIKEPLLNRKEIEGRLNALEALNQKVILREEIISLFKGVYDLERLIGRVNYGNANPRDLLALKCSLQQVPLIKEKLEKINLITSNPNNLLSWIQAISDLQETAILIESAIREDAPPIIRDGGVIKPNFDLALSELYNLKNNSQIYLQEIEERERKKTGITTLRVGYTTVFGYFIEVTKKNLSLVPNGYIRKQTTANSERYITEELKEIEERILGAQEKIQETETSLFQELIGKVAEKTKEIQEASFKLAVLDVLCSLAKVALENNYIKPELVEEKVIQIRNGRHPVIEKMENDFVANDLFLYPGETVIITGPNMSGKSTLMRQTALVVMMAQMGSFVPADQAVLGIVDRIFTRVGAYDDLSSGQSTFMVEMSETASILNNATADSLIIMDEIGRGTSTFDGVSIAWGVAEHIYNKIKAKTLFSTHYHVMNKLSEQFSKIRNCNIAVKEVGNEIIFLHKLIEGGTDQSYGIHVAKLAGMPIEVVERAKEIQEILQKDDEMMRKIKVKKLEEQKRLDGFQ